jgi:general secretion pathway protein I
MSSCILLPARRSSGFSLIEVVVAFSILALGLGALYRVLSTAARQAVLVQHYTEAMALAESKLGEASVGAWPRALDEGTTDGQFRWEQTVQPYSSEDEAADPKPDLVRLRIKVEVRWEHDGAPRSLVLTTVRLRRAA